MMLSIEKHSKVFVFLPQRFMSDYEGAISPQSKEKPENKNTHLALCPNKMIFLQNKWDMDRILVNNQKRERNCFVHKIEYFYDITKWVLQKQRLHPNVETQSIKKKFSTYFNEPKIQNLYNSKSLRQIFYDSKKLFTYVSRQWIAF